MERPANVIPFPNRLGEHPSIRGKGTSAEVRSRRRVSLLSAELRGRQTMIEFLGRDRAEAALAGTVDQALTTLLRCGAGGLTIDGELMRPVIWGTFDGDDHALRALRAAEMLCLEVDTIQG